MSVEQIQKFIKRDFRDVQQRYSVNFGVLISSLNFISNGEVVREQQQQHQQTRRHKQQNKEQKVIKLQRHKTNCQQTIAKSESRNGQTTSVWEGNKQTGVESCGRGIDDMMADLRNSTAQQCRQPIVEPAENSKQCKKTCGIRLHSNADSP
ncbi:hypothetical protein HELRODRAFT_165999 [Helobdella robusta]|uniref:Uncharacterized protein n=1 Tax=Helobdella robusta TaxID=6412 RepID=T1EXK1_HELRO|nr:hypothetical protein HELRODRAFT_165999 [Helobdella robusta]ESN90341.1 hypothetical protein HELRODRAFT_165999 [Helobdella robusta]